MSEDAAPNGRNGRNGHPARNTLLLAAVAAGCGWLLYSRAGEVAEGVQNLIGRQQPRRVVPRKMAVDEPMAGYGA